MSDAAASRDPSCLFCRIVAREIDANIVFESPDVVAFNDINPQAPTHLLIVPTHHIADATALPATDGALLGRLFSVAAACARTAGVAKDGYRLVFNVGEDAGNTVAHLHLHLLGGRPLTWPPG